MPERCSHRGRVRAVVWKVSEDGEEVPASRELVPATVLCQQCMRPISATAVAFTDYSLDPDGWYTPTVTESVESPG